MKKTTLKNYLNFLFLPFILALIVISCKEDVEITQEVNIEEHEHINNSVKHFTIDELPHLDKVLTTVSTSRTSRTASTTFGDLNLSDIIEYVDEDGKESYTFKIENPTNIESSVEFENLHLIRLPNDEGYLAFILRWKPNLEWYSENNYQFQLYNYTGTVDRFDLDYNFLSETTFVEGIIQGNEGGRSSALSRDVVIECDDSVECTCPGDPYCGCSWASCSFVYETGCSVVGGGGGGGDNTGSGTTTGGTGTHIPGGGTSGTSTSTGGYVPNGNGGVVATPPTKAEILSLFLGELTEEQIAWANNDGNRREYEQLMDYLMACPLTPVSGRQAPCVTDFAFAALALEALMDGDEVDYAQKIILDETFKNNTKMKCVYDKLMSIEDSYFRNIVEEMFESGKESNLYLKVANLTSQDAYTSPINLPDGGRAYRIEIDPDFINNSPILLIAQTFIHEIMHAEMIERLVQLGIIRIIANYEVEFIAPEYLIYNGIDDLENQAIVIYTETFVNNTDWAHELFNLEFYRQKLIENIGDFHNSYNDSSFNTQVIDIMGWEFSGDLGVYSALSWQGLQNTLDFENLEVSEKALILQQLAFTIDNSTTNCN